MNNLRQHGIAWYLYIDDHNECFPPEYIPAQGGAGPRTFGGKWGNKYSDPDYDASNRVLNRYLDIKSDDDKGALEIFHCPDDRKPKGNNAFDYHGTSYWLNQYILIYGPGEPRPLSTITSPRNKVWLEMCYPMNSPGHSGRGRVSNKTPVMVLFVDGHAGGVFLWREDVEDSDPNTDKPLIWHPNNTPSGID